MENRKEKKNLIQSDQMSKNEVFRMRLIDFSITVMTATKSMRKDPILWPICDQLVRSATSIGANINEAQGSNSRKDFANYFQIALKSARETRYWIQVVERYDKRYQKSMAELFNENENLINIIHASLKTLRSKL
jgi:four helix bundle protein